MKIILLRHEERGIDVGFNSELTENGILGSLKLVNKIDELNKKYNIRYIYSSPFIRTLQTIFPYSYKYNKKINVEYGLYEYLHNPYFLISKWYYDIESIKDKDLKSIINTKYTSVIDKNDFAVLENEDNLENRIIKFFNILKKKHNFNKDYTILLVTHKGIINKIKKMYFNELTNMDDEFPMGHLEIYDL
jgi:broad specificity phosphatase PhoE